MNPMEAAAGRVLAAATNFEADAPVSLSKDLDSLLESLDALEPLLTDDPGALQEVQSSLEAWADGVVRANAAVLAALQHLPAALPARAARLHRIRRNIIAALRLGTHLARLASQCPAWPVALRYRMMCACALALDAMPRLRRAQAACGAALPASEVIAKLVPCLSYVVGQIDEDQGRPRSVGALLSATAASQHRLADCLRLLGECAETAAAVELSDHAWSSMTQLGVTLWAVPSEGCCIERLLAQCPDVGLGLLRLLAAVTHQSLKHLLQLQQVARQAQEPRRPQRRGQPAQLPQRLANEASARLVQLLKPVYFRFNVAVRLLFSPAMAPAWRQLSASGDQRLQGHLAGTVQRLRQVALPAGEGWQTAGRLARS
ncbi:hypothetical protein ABPG75_006062 [Micractinium tetrahymenae]